MYRIILSGFAVHQTGLLNGDDKKEQELKARFAADYMPFQFIYEQMPDVIAAADVILSRAGANSIWEAAVMYKPMVLVPLCGSGTRGDQVDNARFFEQKNAAIVLVGEQATDKNLCNELEKMLEEKTRNEYALNVRNMVGTKRPALTIAELLFKEL